MMKKAVLSLAALIAVSSVANAAVITHFTSATVPTVAPDFAGNPSGDIVNTMTIDTTGNWNSANVVITLTKGSLFYSSLNGANPPGSLTGLAPNTAYDTYVQKPDGTNAPSAGGAVTIAPGSSSKFDATGVNYQWFQSGGTFVGNGLKLGQFTLTPDAVGTIQYGVFTGSDAQISSAPIANGIVVVPEPASLGLLGLGALGLVARRRRA